MANRPNPLRVVTGTGHRPIPKPAEYDARSPEAPEDLPQEGRRCGATSSRRWPHDNSDRYVLELISSSYAEWKEAAHNYRGRPVETGSRGQSVRSPRKDIQIIDRRTVTFSV
jgi:hypothetical protein